MNYNDMAFTLDANIVRIGKVGETYIQVVIACAARFWGRRTKGDSTGALR
jgi:hypothetical protein